MPGIRYKEGEEPTNALYRGFGVTVFLSAIVLAIVTYQLLGSWWFVLAGIIGLLNSIAFVVITMYYTEGRFRPVRDIVRADAVFGAEASIEAGHDQFVDRVPYIAHDVCVIRTCGRPSQVVVEASISDVTEIDDRQVRPALM